MIPWWARFRTLTPDERGLLARAAVLMGTAALALRWTPLTALRQWLVWLTPRWRRSPPHPIDRVAWAVGAARRHLPWKGTCLAQALVAEALLRQAGEDAWLCLGVTRGGQGRIHGHAWVEAGGRVVVGGDERDRYTLLGALESGRHGPGPSRA